MNASINPKSAAGFTVMGPQRSVLMRVRWALLFAALMLAILPAVAYSQSTACAGIYMKVLGIRTGTGTLACALFDSPVVCPGEFLGYASNIMLIEIRYTSARGDASDIPSETYELAVIHDENMDGKLDANRLEFPTQGYVFSNDLKAMTGAPSSAGGGFPSDPQNMDLAFSLHY